VLGMLRVAACEAPQLEWSAGRRDAQEPVSSNSEPMQSTKVQAVTVCTEGIAWLRKHPHRPSQVRYCNAFK